MAWKFYKKLEPKNHPVLANNSRVEFKTLDHVTGYFPTDNSYVQGELERFMRESRYGITEISEVEFHTEYVQKKTQLGEPRPLWREEIAGKRVTGHSPFQTLGAEGVAAAVAVSPAAKPATAVPIAVADQADGVKAAVAAPPDKPEFKPPVGRRTPKVMPAKAS